MAGLSGIYTLPTSAREAQLVSIVVSLARIVTDLKAAISAIPTLPEDVRTDLARTQERIDKLFGKIEAYLDHE